MRLRKAGLVLAVLGLSAVAAMLTGCYERVVGARGMGAERIETEERYQQDTALDRWFYGDEKKEKHP